MTSAGAARIDRRLIIFCLLLLAFFVRLAIALKLPDQSAALPDAVAYREAAEHLSSTLEIGTPIFMPLYPAMLALTGSGIGQLLLDTVLSTILVWLVFELAMSLFDDVAAAFIAAFIASIYPHFIFFSAVA